MAQKTKLATKWAKVFRRKVEPEPFALKTVFEYNLHAKLKVADLSRVDNWKSLLKACEKECLPFVKVHAIVLMGKKIDQPRKTAFFGPANIEGYRYSGQLTKTIPMPWSLQLLLDKLNHTLESQYNGVLVNFYHDANSSIGFHSDAETGLGQGGNVVSISWRGTRRFRIKEKTTNKTLFTHLTNPCEMMIMEGKEFQKKLLHGIPKQVKPLPRWSFTFRKHKVTSKK